MRPELGLVCITRSDALRYRTVTRTRLRAATPAARTALLRAIYAANLATLARAPRFCIERGIRLYRIPSGIFPFADDAMGAPLLEAIAGELGAIGRAAASLGVRLVMHPDQFVVLNSESEAVVTNSLRILAMHGRILDALAQPRTPWAVLEIHGGRRGRAAALREAIAHLPPAVRGRIALENDESRYDAAEILAVCEDAGVPMVFDAHHHVCFRQLASYEHPSIAEFTIAAARTWPDPSWQLVHISNGRNSFTDRGHADEISVMPSAYSQVPWIEVEAKAKEQAIARLQAEWLPGLKET
ncbi:MAG: UV DNA damage repair endonuclease UvsE [Gammaproteobacteria bacterium]|nr:UV DNA damage repair endonuclease UvsE [Gammaproteobacteria bacterium]